MRHPGRFGFARALHRALFHHAILFVIFDVETIFLFPWAVRYRTLGCLGAEVAVFLAILIVGYIWAYKKGALEWFDGCRFVRAALVPLGFATLLNAAPMLRLVIPAVVPSMPPAPTEARKSWRPTTPEMARFPWRAIPRRPFRGLLHPTGLRAPVPVPPPRPRASLSSWC